MRLASLPWVAMLLVLIVAWVCLYQPAQEDTQRLVCDVCDEELECGHPDNPCL